MRALRLTRPLVLEAADRVADGAGGFARTWVARGVVWAAVEVRAGGDGEAGEIRLGAAPHRITVRAAPEGSPQRPVAGQRFREGTRIFAIEAVSERDAGGRYLVCFAREEVVA